MYSTLCFILCVATFAISSVTKAQQDCLLASNGQRPLPNFVRPGGRGEPRFTENPIIAIITSYRFNCCGAITEWRAFVEASNLSQLTAYFITFYVWRPNSPSPVDTDGCYTLVDVNSFVPIHLADPNGPDRGIITGIPLVNERINVQPGDVIGFFLENPSDIDGGIQFAGDTSNDPDYTNETVWYTTGVISAAAMSCPLPVGPGRILSSSTNRAPLITATVSMSPCPMPTSSHSSQPTLPITPSTSSHQLLTPTLQSTPTPMDTTTSRPVGTADNVGLYVGITVPVSVLVVGGILVGVVILCCVATKKNKSSKVTANNLPSRNKEGETEKETSLTTETNEAYGKLSEATSTSQPVVYDYIDPPTIPHNQAYGDIFTTADTDYYVNEELGGAAELRVDSNEAYGVSRRAPSDNEPSIPTTENEAYTSGSANTERLEEGMTYDYARV